MRWRWNACWLLATSWLAGCPSEPAREVPLDEVQMQVADTVCAGAFDCPCMYRNFSSEQECRDVVAELDSYLQQYTQQGLTWDPTCLGAELEILDDAGCDAVLPETEDCAPPCHYFHGTRREGATCEIQDLHVSDCAQGLDCVVGHCRPPCWPGEAGSSCDVGCGEAFFCDVDDLCQPRAQTGEPCDAIPCLDRDACESMDPADPSTPLVCKAPAELGEPCRGHSRCISGYCPRGYCEELPQLGESCAGTFVCAPGFDCVDERCAEGQAAVCTVDVFYY